jgi:hypothetical protein
MSGQNAQTNEYIPFSEALELFHPLDKNAFFYRVRKGEISTIEGTTERDTQYKISDIVEVREALMKKKAKKRESKRGLETEVDWQKISDLPAVLKLDLTVFKEEIVGDISLYMTWERKNPKITLISYEKGNRENVLAYLSLVPLPEEVILSILKGERSDFSITLDEVEDYKRPGGYTLFADGIATHPDHPEQINNIIRELLRFWCDQYPERYIEKIYVQAASEAGDIFVRKLYFSPLYHIADNAYILDLRKPAISRLVKNFQECLEQKATSKNNNQ